MKKLKFILLLLSTFFFLNANAQVFIGGNLNFYASNRLSPNKSTTNSINISPEFGKYLSDKIALGVALNVSFSQHKTDVTSEGSSSFGINPFLKYYFINFGKFSIFGQGNVGIEYEKEKFTDSNETKRMIASIDFYPGLSYDLNNHLSLQTSISFLNFGYNYITTVNETSTQKTSSFYLTSGLNNIIKLGDITIGAVYKF